MTDSATGGARTNAGAFRPGPLVEAARELTDGERARAARQLILPGLGELGQRRLRAAKVLVIGAGGLGSASIPYLVGAGVGTVAVIDNDRVELSNLHRQIAHRTADIGKLKAQSLRESMSDIDPSVQIETHCVRLTAGNALDLFAPYDLIIDGSDNFQTRYLTNDAAEMLGKPLIWGAILQYYGQVSVAWHRHGPGYRDLFPVPPAPEDVLSCGTGGVLPSLCGTIGSLLASEALKLITGIGEPLIGRVLVYDALAARTQEIDYQRDPNGTPITELTDYDQFCGGEAELPPHVSAEELAQMLHAGDSVQLIDVRNEDERARVLISGSEWLPLSDIESNGAVSGAFGATTASAAVDDAAVIYCEQDPRSIRAVRLLTEQGSRDVKFLRGGIKEFATRAPDLIEFSQNP